MNVLIQSADSAGGLRVLVVDDDRDNANSLAMLLAVMGHDARAAYDATAALAAATAWLPDVVFLDLAMPVTDGFHLAAQLALGEAHAGPVLVAVSGYGDAAHRRRAAEAGFSHFLVKPADPDLLSELLAVVRCGRDSLRAPA